MSFFQLVDLYQDLDLDTYPDQELEKAPDQALAQALDLHLDLDQDKDLNQICKRLKLFALIIICLFSNWLN